MPAEGSEEQMRYRARKRARGECIYGGCHEASAKGSMCLHHYTIEYERKMEGKLKLLTSDQLLASRARHQRAITRINWEITRRNVSGDARRRTRSRSRRGPGAREEPR
jgi:hypothetical protein